MRDANLSRIEGLSVFLYRSFLGIGSLVFSGTQHGVRGPCGVVHDRARFLENMFCAKNRENRPNPGFFE